MIPLSITLNLELDPWTDLHGNVEGQMASIERIGLLPAGTVEGRATVELLIRTESGHLIVAETTLRLFNLAIHALLASPIAQMEDM